MWTIPNLLTILRILLIIPIIVFYRQESYGIAFLICGLSSLTDFFDGKLARALNQTSTLGALLDPIADKFFELALYMVFYMQGEVPLYFLVLLYLRNVCQLATIPLLMLILKIPFKVEPKLPAKIGSALGMVLINALIFSHYLTEDITPVLKTANWLVFPIAAALEFYLFITFVPRLVQIIRGKHDTFD